MKKKPTIAQIRRAVADYIGSEGCDCCRGSKHPEHQTALAKLLRVPRYHDDSGNNFAKFRTPDKK